MIFLFTDQNAEQSQVGGKGYSLIKMTGAGFPVPKGMVLSVQFFNEWVEALMKIEDLRLDQSDSDEVLKKKTRDLQKHAAGFQFSPNQRQMLEEKLKALEQPEGRMYSVRSSSPEEDMQGASFAGMYETYLGVTTNQLEARIRDVFISCIDFRVVAYKRQKGFDHTRYAIAVVVMAQIQSDVAGVAFSINPLNNCYDEVVINANFGLGESVVSGDTVPDQFVVDAHSREILSRKIGEKAVAVTLDQSGGTSKEAKKTSDQPALSDAQVLELTEMVKKVETHYEMPMDTEWAYEGGTLYMLQARPITSYIPLHPVFQTQPGEPKRLYLDLTLIEQGFQTPLSVMGTDCFRELSDAMGMSAAGTHVARKPGDFVYGAGGRAYVNLSAEMLLESQDKTAGEYEGLDIYAAQVIRDADMTPYQAHYTAKGILKGTKAMFLASFKNWDTIRGILKGRRHPEELRELIDEKGAQFTEEMDRLEQEPLSFKDFAYQALRKQADLMIHVTIPSLVDAESAKGSIKKILKEGYGDELADEADRIDRGLPHNITTEMSCKIYDLMSLLKPEDLENANELKDRILNRDLPEPFLAQWDDFMNRFGFRCPREVDVRTPRYHENPEIVIQQMQNYRLLPTEDAPRAVLKRRTEERERAYKTALERFSGKDKKDLEKHYEVLVNLGGYREIHKYYLVYAVNKIRRKALAIARNFKDSGRIDHLDDVFYLTVSEVQEAISNEQLDMKEMIAHHRAYMDIAEKVDNYPPVIDSRGKILRPNRKEAKPGEIIGDPVSAGKVSGRVVVVNYVGEKEISKGDILVAKAADPGWTPLFINAAGVLLEVGGMLQHGSLIAREYGKPCIAGIQNLTDLVKDGDVIEMDGASGIVKKTEKGVLQ